MNKPVIMIDFGGVYFNNGTLVAVKKISKKFGINESRIKEALLGPARQKHGTGKLTSREFWNHASKHLGLSRSQVKEIKYIWHSSFVPQKGMKQLVRRLRRKYYVIVLSGTIRERIRFLNVRYNLKKEFHEQHYSFDYGINKPDVRLFKKTVKKLKINYHDCIMVDNDNVFLSNVKKTGGKTILFKSAKQLEKDLKKLGVII